jgi:hypothetical protein
LSDALSSVIDLSPKKLVEKRLARLMSYGKFLESE